MPVFTHYGVELWVPEVGGPVDPDSEAHDLIMSVFGGMSKGERNRIKIRVRSAMAAQAAIEGRFLGGRPPYGYRIADAGPHPNPAKAADGKRLHKLEPDPETAWVVRRIFAEYLAGRGLFAIAEGLTRDRIPSPSQHDAARNPHRTGQGWAKSAVRAILRNPRYTGRQVWNKQRKDEILLDVNDVARGYETRLRWNDTGQWVWSDTIAQEPLVSVGGLRGRPGHHGRRRARPAGQPRDPPAGHATPTPCAAGCTAGSASAGCKASTTTAAYYRCRYPKEYALASHVRHPGNVYLREADVLPAIDRWLAVIFAPAPAHPDHPRDASSPGPARHPRARRASPGHPGHHRRLRRPPRPLPGHPRRRSRPADHRRMDPPGQGRTRRRTRPRRQPGPPPARPPAHRRRHPRAYRRPRQTCATSSATPSPPRRQPSTASSGSRSPSSPDKQKSGPK